MDIKTATKSQSKTMPTSIDNSSDNIDDVDTFTLADRECVPSLVNIVVGRKLGNGSFKTVYQKCSDSSCTTSNEVLQVISARSQEEILDIRKEASLLRAIAVEARAKGLKPIVLPILSYHECDKTKKAFIVQLQISETMEGLGQRQYQRVLFPNELSALIAPNKIDVVIFSIHQLREAFKLGRELYQRYGLIHGDLKPDNIFVLPNGQLILGDLGFTGSFRGAMSTIAKPRSGFTKNFGCRNVPVNPQVRPYYNVWQAELILLKGSYVTLVPVYSPRFDTEKFAMVDSVNQLGIPELTIPVLARERIERDCDEKELMSRINGTREDRVALQESNAPVAAKHFDPTATDGVPDPLLSTVELKQLYAKLPIPLRYIIRQGIEESLVEHIGSVEGIKNLLEKFDDTLPKFISFTDDQIVHWAFMLSANPEYFKQPMQVRSLVRKGLKRIMFRARAMTLYIPRAKASPTTATTSTTMIQK